MKIPTARVLDNPCPYCGLQMDWNDPQRMPVRDHRVPRSRGGGNGANLVWACYQCDHTKGNMTEAEFIEWIRRGRPNKSAYLREIGL